MIHWYKKTNVWYKIVNVW